MLHALAVTLLACAPQMALVRPSLRARQPDPPSILIVILDDVGLLNGNLGDPVAPTTPTLDWLASEGVSFTRCYAAPTCQPARVALFTGHWWASDAGVAYAAPGVHTPALAERFIPERLASHESALFGKWHLGGNHLGDPEGAPASQGFDWYYTGSLANIGMSYDSWLQVEGQQSATCTVYQPDQLEARFLQMYPLAPSPSLTVVSMALAHAPFHDPGGHGPFGHLAQPIVKYEWMIEKLDESLGDMLAIVDLDETLVIVVGDNGTPPQAGGQRAKETCYERGLRVPLIIAGAGVTEQGTTSDELVWIGDVYATAIAAGGGTLPGSPLYPIRSRDLAPILTGGTFTPRAHVVTGHNWKTDIDNAQRCIVTEDGWKLLQWDEDEDADTVTISREELYDLDADPGETIDVLASNPTVANALRLALEAECLP